MEYFNLGRELSCFRCGIKEIANIACPNGHYICDKCHGEGLFDNVKDFVLKSKSLNPIEIAEYLMDQDNVPMLGCENAWIAAAALMAALKNEGTAKVTDELIVEVLNRTKKQAIGGYCGLTGVCGIVPAIGACFSVILGASCSKDRETAIVMSVAGRIIGTIAKETGPCCCKNFLRKSLDESVKMVKEHLCISLTIVREDNVCKYVDRHPHGCRKEKCSYYKKT
ncbi:hypothetical protein SAMN05443529_13124 [Desulfosporosinus hippei DSM 8344]|uniref:DUF5714 domain-containing protein n=1 Tax=Desulfosporosinus hippei DSM 8344 TaxID=1121419 RepID=A0A1G8J5J2_9FIRM|nr:hypothetical protein SAMN05443529_13124 [Desulfosporosinus hippei DSM 8344]